VADKIYQKLPHSRKAEFCERLRPHKSGLAALQNRREYIQSQPKRKSRGHIKQRTHSQNAGFSQINTPPTSATMKFNNTHGRS
jgi:hypothetical protein